MEGVSAYLLSVSGAAILCAIANRFWGKKSTGTIGKMITSLFMVLTVLHPLADMNIDFWNDMSFGIEQDAADAVQQGRQETQNAMAEIIKEKTAAYILKKAQSLGAEISVEVAVTDEAIPMPERILIRGNAAPYARQQLQVLIAQDLGISKENQIWI